MPRIGIFCPPWTGHLNPLCGLAHELVGRGNEIIFFHTPDIAEKVRERGFRCEVFGAGTCPAGTLSERIRGLGLLDGLEATRAALDIAGLQAKALFDEAPPVIEKAKLDLWVVDHLEYGASTLAAVLGAPFVTVLVGLMRHREEGVPGFSGERYSEDPAVLERDRRFEEEILALAKPLRDFVGAHRERAGLGPFRFETLWSALAQITQQPAEFEYPRKKLPACFHFTGPFTRNESRPTCPFPWERLGEERLIYASFGTVQNRNRRLYEAVAAATAGLDAQVVLSLGGADPSELSETLPGNPLVVKYAPQLEILNRAALMITHAGMNSALECLVAGVPMVAIPLVNDGPGIAARIEWTGTGVRVPVAECEPLRLRKAIEQVLRDDSFHRSARRFQRIIQETDGLRKAADIIQKVAATGEPVLREDMSRDVGG